MTQKNLPKPKGILLALFAVLCVLSSQAAVIPYLPPLQSFGGTAVDVMTISPTTGDFTLEVEGTSGNLITVSGGYFSYTPTSTCTVRFSQRNGIVYVFEGIEYKATITPDITNITYTDITSDINNVKNLLQNPGFETFPNNVWKSYDHNAANIAISNVGTSGTSIRATTALTGAYAMLFHQTARYLTQSIPSGTIKSNTYYKLAFKYKTNATGQNGVVIRADLGTSERGTDIIITGTTTTQNNTTVYNFTSTFKVETVNPSNPVWFCVERTSGYNASPQKLENYDNFTLVEGALTAGITGTSGATATYLAGTAYSPEGIVVNYATGDYYDMTPQISNPSFEDLPLNQVSTIPGWTNTGWVTQNNTSPTWTKDGTYYIEKWIDAGSNLPAASLMQTVSNIPDGYYNMTVSGHAIKQSNLSLVTTGASAFAGSNTVAINTGSNYAINNIQVTGGTLNLGFQLVAPITCNWAGVDNFKLHYIGTVLYPSITAPQSAVSFSTSTNSATIDVTGTNLASDITITLPSSHITLSGANVTGTTPNYTIALANANQLNTITATWDMEANVSGNIVLTSNTASKSVAVSTSDVEGAALSNITLSSGALNVPFAVGTTSYSAKVPADVTTTTVSATTSPSIANVTNSGTEISASNTTVALTGNSHNGANHTSGYTVSWGGNYSLTDWAANGSTDATASIPTVYGWSANPTLTWVLANGTTLGSCRYIDLVDGINSTAANGINYTYGGSNYNGRVLLTRWDGNAGRIFSYPLTLEAGTVYQITGKAASHNGASTLTFGINSSKSVSGQLATGNVTTLTNGLFLDFAVINISVPTTGVYYLNLTSTSTNLVSIADLTLSTKLSQTFTGTIDNTWYNASNWSGNRVPLAGDDVSLSSGSMNIDQNVVANNVNLAPGVKLTVASGKTLAATSLTLQSDATGTATLIDNGTVTGTVTIKQYLTGSVNSETGAPNGRFWYVTSPISNATSGIFIPSAGNKFWSHTEATNAYTQITDDVTVLTPGLGYVARMKENTTVTFTGTPNTGDKTVQISRTSTTNLYRGFNLVGNPYPSFARIKTDDNTDIETSLWFRTKVAATNAMIFDSYNILSGDSVSGSGNPISGFIPPMQAFWVKKSVEGTANLTFRQIYRFHNDPITAGVKLRSTAIDSIPCLRIRLSNGSTKDEALIKLYSNATDYFDDYDTHKITNSIDSFPEIFTMSGKEELAINGMKHDGKDKVIALGFRSGKPGKLIFKVIEKHNLGDSIRAILKDKVKGIEKELTDTTSYEFTTDAATASTDRFSIVIGKVATTLSTTATATADVYVDNEHQINVRLVGTTDNTAKVMVFNTMGQQVGNFVTNAANSILGMRFAPGVYVVNVKTEGLQINKKVVINQ